MSDDAPYDVPAAAREGAKAVQQGVQLARDLGSYMTGVLDTLPKDLVGVLGDRLGFYRAEKWIERMARLNESIRKAGIDSATLRAPSPNLEALLIEASTLEERDELQDLWQRLIAAAVLPGTRDRVRARHIEILKRLEPLDALMLESFEQLPTLPLSSMSFAGVLQAITATLKITDQDGAATSLFALADLSLVITNYDRHSGIQAAPPLLTPEGRNFLSVVRRQI